jgi:hypothetical protein
MEFSEIVNPIKIVVLVTALHAWMRLDTRRRENAYLFVILCGALATETTNSVLSYAGRPFNMVVTAFAVVHHSLWLLLLGHILRYGRSMTLIAVGFIVFALANVLFLEGTSHFNYYTFVVGAFIYLMIFLYESSAQLRRENFDFFLCGSYLLIFAPVIFLFGFSLVFGFRSRQISSAMIHGVKVFDIVSYFSNIVYYTMLNIYIHRQKKAAYAI